MRRQLHHPTAAPSLGPSMQRALDCKRSAQSQVPWAALRQRAHDVKAYVLANLDSLLVSFETEFRARGGAVLWARTAADAGDIFLDIARRHGAKSVVKGKSLVSEELALNARLRAAGIEPVETDLGEFIVALAGQKPSHIIAPAVHLSSADVGRIFEAKLGLPYSADPATLSLAARELLRARYLQAGVGMTGVNFAIAETGTVVVVENEGNAGLSAAAPPVHVLLMGIEKVLPGLADLSVFLQLLARAGTGQKLTSYTHHFLGPEPGKQMYCILIDAGRTDVFADSQTRESLACIRCGACLNVCPVYRRVGGHAYGGVYPGPIGSVVTPQMVGVAAAGELPFASSLCGACREECPVKIDLPRQLVFMRSKAVASRSTGTFTERVCVRLWAAAMMNVKTYRAAVAVARLLQRAAHLLRTRPREATLDGTGFRLPTMAVTTFKEWWGDR
ncbi:MAG: lactate utilization protein [Candidatus Eremiobacteraeota bacterium]|nr:lactate utilization protein [Candidatus Eremiobacteraeota bacterium]